MADWYPASRVEKRAWHVNFKLRRLDFEVKYPILATQKAPLIADCDWYTWWADTMQIEDDREQQFTKYFNGISGNDTTIDVPTSPTWVAPAGKPAEVPPGIERRIREARREVAGYANYSKADGEALGFEPPKTDAPDAASVKPTIKTFPAATGYMFSVVVSGREQSDMWQVSAALAGTSAWKDLGTYNGKSADVHYTSGDGKAAQLQVRVQLRRNNENYGQPSDIVMTTVNP